MSPYLYLAIAIVAEIVATLSLKQSDGFTRLLPSVVTVIGYATAFYLLALTLRSLPTGLVYALWSGVGIVCIALLSWLIHGQRIGPGGAIGIGLIVVGVVVLNLSTGKAIHDV